MIITTVIFIAIIIGLIIYIIYSKIKNNIVINSIENIITAFNKSGDPETDLNKLISENRIYSTDAITDLKIEDDSSMLLKLFRLLISSNNDLELASLEKKGIIVKKVITINKIPFTKIFFDNNTKNILITFRGTTTKEDLVTIDLKNMAKLFNLNNDKFYLHEGFGDILSKVSISILQTLEEIKGYNKIITFGHSMGGSLSFLSPLFLKDHIKKINIYSSAFPTFAEKKALDYIQENCSSSLGFNNRYDYIPYIIPLFFKVDTTTAVAAEIPKNLIEFKKNIGSIANHSIVVYMDYLISLNKRRT